MFAQQIERPPSRVILPSQLIRNRVEVIVRKDSKILIGKYKKKYSNEYFYSLPGGGIKDNESVSDAAKREVLEEIGIVVNNIIPLNIVINAPPIRLAKGYKYDSIYTQWVLADYVTTYNTRINYNTDIAISSQWLTLEDARNVLSQNNLYIDGELKALDQLEWLTYGRMEYV